MWDGSDTLGFISCILGTIMMIAMYVSVLAFSTYIPPILYLIIGGSDIAMGLIAVLKGSKIGIGGNILGALLIIAGVFYLVVL